MCTGFGTIVTGFVVLALAGCGESVSDEELGRVVFEVPEVPEGYEPYELPDLSPLLDTASDDAAASSASAGTPLPGPQQAQPLTPAGPEEAAGSHEGHDH